MNHSSVFIKKAAYTDELLTLAGADTIAAGTILARDTSTLNMVLFVKGGTTNGNGTPTTVLEYEVTATGAGNVPVRVPGTGVVRQDRLNY